MISECKYIGSVLLDCMDFSENINKLNGKRRITGDEQALKTDGRERRTNIKAGRRKNTNGHEYKWTILGSMKSITNRVRKEMYRSCRMFLPMLDQTFLVTRRQITPLTRLGSSG